VLFAPDAAEMYPPGFATSVVPGGTLAELLEGYFRPGHFPGVCTVVAKLLNIVQPDRAYFGEKDWQQLKIIEQMVRDLNLPVQVVPCPTVREPDGLAMSSRNARLSPEGREKARIIPYLLDTAQDLLDSSSAEQQTISAPCCATGFSHCWNPANRTRRWTMSPWWTPRRWLTWKRSATARSSPSPCTSKACA
jgi:pantoate--beta-alanine ligase